MQSGRCGPIEPFVSQHGYPASEAFFDGHFPGNAIVPGAMLVAQLAAHLEACDLELRSIARLKFIRPLGPDTHFEILLKRAGDDWHADFRDEIGVFVTARFDAVRTGL